MGSKIAMCLGASVMLMTAACGGDDALSPKEACNQVAEALCDRLYNCFTAQELQQSGLPATEAECVSSQQAQQSCATQTEANTCSPGQTYHADKAGSCVSQVGGLECAQIRDQNFDIDTAAPACSQVCTAS